MMEGQPMAETKYGKYIIEEPIYKGRFAPIVHICGEKHRCGDQLCAGSGFANFPAEQTIMTITEPFEMKARSHAHDYDQLLYFLGGNPTNFFDFSAEVEITLGEEDEKHLITTSAIVYVPEGMLHCPINFKRVDKPIMFMHICFASEYSRSRGEKNSHPRSYETYHPDQINKLFR
jgi:hypothetical protein